MKRFALSSLIQLVVILFLVSSGKMFAADSALDVEKTVFEKGLASKPLLDRDKVLAEAEAVTAEKYPNANDVLIDDRIVVRYFKDGTSVEWDEWYTKILTEKGRRDNSTVTLPFTIPYSEKEDVQIQALEVIKPDGSVKKVNVSEQSRVMINRSQMGSNIFNPNRKVLRVGIPDLEVGDVIRYFTFYRTRHPRFKEVWADMQVLEHTSPIRHFTYEVFGPEEQPLQNIAVRDRIKDKVSHEQDRTQGLRHHTWTVQDVPRLFKEPRMPPLQNVAQRLLVSTAKGWEEISKWYWSISEPHYETNTAIREKVEALTEGLENRQQKIRALFKFVSQEVRYLGITREEAAPGYEPHDVDETFNNLAGVCRDKAALLVAMLREAGFSAYPVLIDSRAKKDPDVPLPWFNHAILCIQNPDGSYQLMDPTDETTKRLFPAYLNDKSYLVAKPDGEELRTSPIVPAAENLMVINTEGRVTAEGRLTAEANLTFEGINDNMYRGYFARLNQERRRRYFEKVINNIVPGGKVTEFELTPSDMQNTDQQLRASLKFTADNVLIPGNKAQMLSVPYFGTRVGYINFVLGETGLQEREYPFQTGVSCGVEETFSLELAEDLGKVRALPRYPELKNEDLEWTREIEEKNQSLIGETNFKLHEVSFTPEAYKKLKGILEEKEYATRKRPILEPPEDAESAAEKEKVVTDDDQSVILEETVSYTVKDKNNWTKKHHMQRRILSYAGKKEHAELRINYNTRWENVKVLEAKVESPDGKVEEVGQSQINRMDAGWVASAPRYPASKTLVVSFPNVQEGSVITYTIEKQYEEHPFFSTYATFRNHAPIRKKTVRVQYPKDLKIHVLRDQNGVAVADSLTDSDSGPVKTEKKVKKGNIARKWHVSGVPGVERESLLPPWYGFNPTVFLSAGSWKTYAQNIRKNLLEAVQLNAAVKEKVTDLVGDIENERQKLKKMRDFLSRKIRKAGPALHEISLDNVTVAHKVFEQRYGNTTDKAVLLYAMLQNAGFQPEFVLASDAPRLKKLQTPLRETPRPAFFDEVLVRVKSRGEPVYMNNLNQYHKLGTTRHNGRPGLLLADNKVITIRSSEKKKTSQTSYYQISLQNNGDATLQQTKHFYGLLHGQHNKTYAELTPHEREQKFQRMVSNLSEAAAPLSDLKTEFDTYPGTENFRVRWDKFAVKDGAYMYFQLPASFQNLIQLGADKRENPLYRSGPRREKLVVDIILPDKYQDVLTTPSPVQWGSPPSGNGRIVIETRRIPASETPKKTDLPGKQTILRITYRAELLPAVIPANAYDNMLQMQERLSRLKNRTVLLRSNN